MDKRQPFFNAWMVFTCILLALAGISCASMMGLDPLSWGIWLIVVGWVFWFRRRQWKRGT